MKLIIGELLKLMSDGFIMCLLNLLNKIDILRASEINKGQFHYVFIELVKWNWYYASLWNSWATVPLCVYWTCWIKLILYELLKLMSDGSVMCLLSLLNKIDIMRASEINERRFHYVFIELGEWNIDIMRASEINEQPFS
jgi:hypothetical protein